jgi:hypothetical protein
MGPTAVWISLDESGFFGVHSQWEASVVMWLKMLLTKEFKMAIAVLDIPVLGCTCTRALVHFECLVDV